MPVDDTPGVFLEPTSDISVDLVGACVGKGARLGAAWHFNARSLRLGRRAASWMASIEPQNRVVAHRGKCIPPGEAAAGHSAHIKADDQVAHEQPPVHDAVLRPACPSDEQTAQDTGTAASHLAISCASAVCCDCCVQHRMIAHQLGTHCPSKNAAHKAMCLGNLQHLPCSRSPRGALGNLCRATSTDGPDWIKNVNDNDDIVVGDDTSRGE